MSRITSCDVSVVGEAGKVDGSIAFAVASPAVRETSLKVGSNALRLNRQQRIRQAILLLFAPSPAQQQELLRSLSEREWRETLRWLDISGLALYFSDRLEALEIGGTLPAFVIERLRRNATNNIARTRGMIEESIALQQEFQRFGVCYATLKGLSLTPVAVPRPELRHQFDLDYLVAEEHADVAAAVLKQQGYRLYAVSGTTREFKRDCDSFVPIEDIYCDLPGRAVELHLEPRRLRLDRGVQKHLYGIHMPMLCPVDVFIHQGLHVFKDICSVYSRAAHLLEFYRHVQARHDDDRFWRELRARAEMDRKASLGLGVAVGVLTVMMGDFAPAEFKEWTMHRLPRRVGMWVERYAWRIACSEFPGTKLYLLLQKELERAGIAGKRSVHDVLFPLRLPPQVIQASPREALPDRLRRSVRQLQYIGERVQFHSLEGVRFAWESYLWRRLSKGSIQ